MKTRLTALAAGILLGGSLLVAGAGVVTATTPPVASGPAGHGLCAPQAGAAASAAASAAPSGAKGAAVLAALKAFANCEINRRETTLTTLSAHITSSKTITSTDAAALQSEISSEKSGLSSLESKIDADTTLVTLRADIVTIVTGYRVYVLVVPQSNLTIAADTVLATQARFASLNTALSNAIATAQANGKDTTAAQADLDAMNASVTAAMNLASPLPAQLIALTPAEYNAGTAGPILTSSRKALGQARDDLKSAVADAVACRNALK